MNAYIKYRTLVENYRNNALASSVSVHDVITAKYSNNFSVIRLTLALMVVYGHSFLLFAKDGYDEPLTQIMGFVSVQALAVNMFFFISGILITQSYFNSKSIIRFWIMRFTRIWPALIVCVLLSAFVIGPIVTSYTTAEYFKNHEFFLYLRNIFLIRSFRHDSLPGVFVTNLESNVVNGSLWSLYYEILCYVFLFCILLFVVNITKRKFWGYMIILVTISMLLLTPTAFRGIITFVFTAANVFRTFGSFAVGAFVYFFAKKIPIKYQYFGVLLILCIGFYPLHTNPFYPYLFNTVIMYGILCLAYAPSLTKIKLKNDYSYGIYLYGYLVQQTIAYFFTLTAYQSMLLAFPITIACGMLSWHLIEKRCLDFGKSLSKKI